MKKMVLMAVCLFVCSSAMATNDDPPKRNQWSTENCKDAGVTTKVDNDYDTNSYKSKVSVDNSRSKDYETRTTVTDYGGNKIDELTTNYGKYKNATAEGEYKRDVKAETECRFKN